MSGCKEGEVFLDPFAGTGSLVIEAYEIGARPVALDISGSMVRGAIRNMRRFGQEWLGAVRCDSFNMPVSFVQAVATDVPYGRASSTLGRSTEEIVKRTLVACSSVMSEGSRMVLMHPSTVPVEPTSDWVTVEELQLHVHKRLTRTISVLKRT
jgi:tRNA (guanine10-N2)-dimethyltransferase